MDQSFVPSHSQRFARVAIATPLRKLFDYKIPEDMHITSGMRVLITFGRQEKIAVVHEIISESSVPSDKLKFIIAVLDKKRLFTDSILKLIHWSSQYYQGALGEVYEAALPMRLRKITPTLKKQIEDQILVTPLSSSLSPSSAIPFSLGEDKQVINKLNNFQKSAIEKISQDFGKFQTFLLEGVTGSGKTEVYLHIVEAILQQGKQALILVPEIGLTPQLLSRFQNRFSCPIALLHSSLTEKKRYEAWEMARTGQASIVIGTRSAIFTPLPNPGILIIDEEHDGSFKQQEGFRYHARDLMILRGSLEQCPVILGSATPSFETLHNANNHKYSRLPLPNRAGKAKPPTFKILDIRHKKLEEGVSTQLFTEIEHHLNKQGQVLLFLNRRGFAPILMCFDCGYIAQCKNCDAKLTVHNRSQKLLCHHCDLQSPFLTTCLSCASTSIKPLGIGTERIEDVLKMRFPDKHIVRLDRDTTRTKGSLESAFQDIRDNKAEIIIGTQMIAKGHDFPNVTLVGVIDTDHALYSSDFRSLERMGQLLTQVAGRAGRAEKLGEVVLQTCHPEHPLLKILLEEGYAAFAEKLLLERKTISLPPYSYQTLLRSEATTLENAMNFLQAARTEANGIHKQSVSSDINLSIHGPIPSPMERRIGKYHAQLLLQSHKRHTLQALVAKLIPQLDQHPLSRKVRWSIDVDPIDLF